MNSAQTRFFAGRSSCGMQGFMVTPNFTVSSCLSAYGSCNTNDRTILDTAVGCWETATICSSGNDTAAMTGFFQCFGPTQSISAACQDAIGGGE